MIVMLWRAGLRISEALALNETDLDPDRGSVLVRHGKGDKRREVGMDRWAWAHLEPWLELREDPAGRRAVLRPARADTRAAVRARRDPRQLHHAAAAAGVRRRFAPHQLRHAHAVEMSREGISLIVIQRQLGHADLAITSRYLRGIDNTEIIQAVHERPEPMIPASRRLAPGANSAQLIRHPEAAVSSRPHRRADPRLRFSRARPEDRGDVTPSADEIRRSLEVHIAELETEVGQLKAALGALAAGPGTTPSDHEMRADAPRNAATGPRADRLIPHAIVRMCERWDAEGRRAQAAAVWQRDRWMAAMPDHAGMLGGLPNRLDRSIVRQRVRDAPATTRGMFEAMVIVYAWGWSVTSVGVTRAQTALGAGVERRAPALLAAREAMGLRGPLDGYTALAGPYRVKGLGPSFGSKFLYFASPDDSRALDSRPARGGLPRSRSGAEPEPDPLRGVSQPTRHI